MNRTAFLIDGFNLYHSLKVASRDLGGVGTRWLDIRASCHSYLHVIGGRAQITGIFYFSALAKHMEATKPDVTRRHEAYIACLESTGVVAELARFKEKRITCPSCQQAIIRHEEKETDVAIATRTGDSDVAPAVRAAQRRFPDKAVCCCFPYRRESFDLRRLALKSFRIAKEQYVRHQLPDPVVLEGGRRIHKPPAW